MDKIEVLKRIKNTLIFPNGYVLSDVDEHKPWGAYYRLADECAEQFVQEYFPDKTVEELGQGGSLSPKFLIFEINAATKDKKGGDVEQNIIS